MVNKEIKVKEWQDERIWIHSTSLGYGKWFYNSELREAIQSKK